MRRRMLAVALASVAAMLSVLAAPVAWAGDQAGAAAPVTESPAASTDASVAPVALAHTGLDITVPTIVGLVVLVLGTALVAWAVLRGSRSRGSHS